MAKKIFMVLGTVVGCIIAIAIGINVLLPNGIAGMSNNIELALQQATGATIDFNGDGCGGADGRTTGYDTDSYEDSGLNGFNGEITGGN